MEKFISKIKDSCKKVNLKKAFMAFAFMLTLGVTMLEPVATPATTAYAATPTPKPGSLSQVEQGLGLNNVNENKTNNMLGNVISLIAMLARVVGILLGVYGLYKLIVAFKDQDANGITQGVVLLAVGIILIMFKTIVAAVFGITVS